MPRGKYCDYYWSTKKEKSGKWIWEIQAEYNGEVVQSSLDNEDEDDKFLDTETAARSDAYHAIQDHYT